MGAPAVTGKARTARRTGRTVPGRRQGNLPEAGHARREELKRRMDSLNDQMAELEQDMGVDNDPAHPPVDLASITIENELASKFDMLRVPFAQPEFAYSWVNFATTHGIQLTAKQAEGWEVVHKSMPDAKDLHYDVYGRCVIGDVCLMRMQLDQHVALQRRERAKRRLQQEGIDAALEELGEKYRAKGVGINVLRELSPMALRRAMMQAQAAQLAGQRFDGMLRTGAVPGMQVGR